MARALYVPGLAPDKVQIIEAKAEPVPVPGDSPTPDRPNWLGSPLLGEGPFVWMHHPGTGGEAEVHPDALERTWKHKGWLPGRSPGNDAPNGTPAPGDRPLVRGDIDPYGNTVKLNGSHGTVADDGNVWCYVCGQTMRLVSTDDLGIQTWEANRSTTCPGTINGRPHQPFYELRDMPVMSMTTHTPEKVGHPRYPSKVLWSVAIRLRLADGSIVDSERHFDLLRDAKAWRQAKGSREAWAKLVRLRAGVLDRVEYPNRRRII